MQKDKVVKYQTVVETIERLVKLINDQKMSDLKGILKKGMPVGKYTIIDIGESYTLLHEGEVIYKHINLLETAMTVIELYSKNALREIIDLLMADECFAKNKHDIAIFSHVINTTTNSAAYLVAVDRLELASARLLQAKQLLSLKRNSSKLSKIDK